MSTLCKAGRPTGSDTQLAPVERVRKHRMMRAASDAVRVDFSLDQECAVRLGQLLALRRCLDRKDAIQRAIHIAYLSAYGEPKCTG